MLDGKTKMVVPPLENSPKSFISFFPFALKTMLIEPIPSSNNSLAQNISAVENYCYILIGLILLFFISTQKINSPLILSFLTIAFLLYLIIGYTVCFSGAIVRYRSIILPFSILPFVLMVFGKHKTENQL
jgi:predicted neutral ceramidase superfamily lipid hydrolase